MGGVKNSGDWSGPSSNAGGDRCCQHYDRTKKTTQGNCVHDILLDNLIAALVPLRNGDCALSVKGLSVLDVANIRVLAALDTEYGTSSLGRVWPQIQAASAQLPMFSGV